MGPSCRIYPLQIPPTSVPIMVRIGQHVPPENSGNIALSRTSLWCIKAVALRPSPLRPPIRCGTRSLGHVVAPLPGDYKAGMLHGAISSLRHTLTVPSAALRTHGADLRTLVFGRAAFRDRPRRATVPASPRFRVLSTRRGRLPSR